MKKTQIMKTQNILGASNHCLSINTLSRTRGLISIVIDSINKISNGNKPKTFQVRMDFFAPFSKTQKKISSNLFLVRSRVNKIYNFK